MLKSNQSLVWTQKAAPHSSPIGLSLRSSPIGARVRNKWEAKRSLSTLLETDKAPPKQAWAEPCSSPAPR